MKRATRALLALLAVCWAVTARGEWVQVPVPAGVNATTRFNTVVIAGGEGWVIGEDDVLPVVLRGIESPVFVPPSEHGGVGALRTACGFGDGSLHAFGKNGVHLSWSAAGGTWTKQTLFSGATPKSVSCLGTAPNDLVYVAGSDLIGDPFLGEWRVTAGTTRGLLVGFFVAIDAAGFRSEGDGVLGINSELHSFQSGATAKVGDAVNFVFQAIRFAGANGLTVARSTDSSLVLSIGVDNALTTGGALGFLAVNDATLLESGFAVAVGDAGSVAVSHDGGASWSLRSIPTGPNLYSVACRDEVRCYLAGASASLYRWQNEAPTAQITAIVDGTTRDPVGSVLAATGDENVCLTAIGADLEEQPLTWLWNEPSLTLKGASGVPLDGSTVASPECFDVPTCGGAFEIGATVSDGELTGLATVSLQATAALVLPTLQVGFTNGFVNGGLLSGTDSTEASISATHPCSSTFQYAWTCLDSEGAVFDPGNEATVGFANPGDLCQERTVDCNVLVTPSLAGQPSATAGLTVRYAAAASRPTTLTPSFSNVSAEGVVAVGQTGSVTLAPENRCAASYTASWSCSDGIDPGPLALGRSFVHPGVTACGGESVDCTVTVTPDVGDPVEQSFTVRYAPSARPVAIQKSFEGALVGDAQLLSGETGRVTLAPSQEGCVTGFAATWSCSDGVNPGADVLFRDFANSRSSGCADEVVDCSVELISLLTGESAVASFSVSLAPNPGPVQARADFSAEFGGDDRLEPGQSGQVTLAASQGTCAPVWQTAWSCSDGLDPAPGALSRNFANARGIGCSDERISCDVEVVSPLTGERATASFSVALAPTLEPVMVSAGYSAEFSGERLAAGRSGRVTLTASQGACSPSWLASWSCSDGVSPAGGELWRDFANVGATGCADQVIDCSVVVTSSLGGRSTAVGVSVVLEPDPGAVQAVAEFSSAFAGRNWLDPGQSGAVRVAASHAAGCPAEWSATWSCSDGVGAGPDPLQRDFSNARTSGCSDERIDCSVAVVSSLTGESASSSFSVVLSPNPGPTSVGLAFEGFGAGNALGDGQSGTVIAAATSECPGGFDYLWRCDGLPDVAGAARGFAHGGRQCADQELRCSVQATPVGAGRAASAELSVWLAASAPFPASLEVDLSGATTLGEGGTLSASVVPTHCPGSSYAYAWECEGAGASGQGATASFVHPGLLCEPARAWCQVSVTATSAAGVAQPAATLAAPVEAEYLAAFHPPSNLRVSPLVAEAGKVAAEARIDAECPFSPGYAWRASLRSTGEALGEGSGTSFEAALPPLCGHDYVDFEITETTTGLTAVAELPVEGWRGELSLEEPSEASYERRPRIACGAVAAPILLETVTSGCVQGFAWRQASGPALAFEQRDDGALLITPGAEFAAFAGRQARFEVEAFNEDGRTAARAYELTFVAEPFLKIGHVADRPMAAAGEVVAFEVSLGSGCAELPEAVDLRLSLDDLDYLAGSARLDGVVIGDPDESDGELVFRAIPLKAGSEPRLSYSARRRVVGSGNASSVASAWLSVAPEMRVSEDAPAGAVSETAAVPALACSCGQAGAPALPWIAALALVLLRRRCRPSAC